MSRRQLKMEVVALLQQASLETFAEEIRCYQLHQLLNPLFIALCHSEENVRWNAVYSFGWLVDQIARKDFEAARVVMRRFLWSLNDESGGIGWGIPESMAEVMCRNDTLRKEYLHMLISYMREDGDELHQDGNYLELELLQRGLLWGIGRLCQEHQQEMVGQEIVEDLTDYLDSTDLHVVGLAIWCLGILGEETGLQKAERFRSCKTTIQLYLDDKLVKVSVAELAEQALGLDGKRGCFENY